MPIAANNSLSSLLDLYTKARGTTSSSSTQSNISKEGVDGLIQQILSSTQGLAAVSSGQKAAGLYNSSANSMLTNDLLSQTTGKVASLQAGSTTTQKQGGISGSDLSTGLILAAGKSLLGPSISGAAKKLGFGAGTKSIGQSVADKLGLGESDAVDSGSVNLFEGQNPADYSSNLDIGTSLIDIDGSSIGNMLGDVGSDVYASAGEEAGADLFGDWFG